jgi:cold shock CspA family protein
MVNQLADKERFHGRVRMWDDRKGFGFVLGDHGVLGLFVHVSDLMNRGELSVGDQVEYGMGQDRGGRPKALEVYVLTGQASGRSYESR